MKFFIPLIIFSFLFSAQLMSVEIITNGDFEEPLSTGWQEATSGSNITINRATYYDPDPDYEAYVGKSTGSGYARLYQIVDIPATDLNFFVNAKLYAHATSSAWAGGTVVISYLDEHSSLLGETYICYISTYCPWTNSPTSHIIEVSDSLWHDYGFNIENELTNLSGVNPSDIKKIRVSLFNQIYHC